MHELTSTLQPDGTLMKDFPPQDDREGLQDLHEVCLSKALAKETSSLPHNTPDDALSRLVNKCGG